MFAKTNFSIIPVIWFVDYYSYFLGIFGEHEHVWIF